MQTEGLYKQSNLVASFQYRMEQAQEDLRQLRRFIEEGNLQSMFSQDERNALAMGIAKAKDCIRTIERIVVDRHDTIDEAYKGMLPDVVLPIEAIQEIEKRRLDEMAMQKTRMVTPVVR